MRATRLWLALGMLLACGEGAAGKRVAPSAGYETLELGPSSPSTIAVIDPGQPPITPMRMHPPPGLQASIELLVGMQTSVRAGDRAMPAIAVPTTEARLSAEVLDARPGDFSVRYKVEHVDVVATPETPAAVVDELRRNIEPLRELRVSARVGERGERRGATAEIPRDLPAAVHQQIRQLTESLSRLLIELPEAPVGVGARWTVSQDVTQSGMKLRQRSSVVMTERDGDRATLELSVRQQLLEPNVAIPGMAGARARVGRFESSGRGSLRLDLRHPVPSSFELHTALSMTVDVAVMGQDQRLDVELEIDMTVTRS